MTDEEPLNSAALQLIQKLGGPSLVRQVIGLFLEDAPRRLQAAREALERGKWEDVAGAVHALKSSSGQIGAQRMQALSESIEHHASEKNQEPLPTLLRDLEAAFARARAGLERHREELR